MRFWRWFWFPPGTPWQRGRARLVMVTCLSLIAAMGMLILTWLLSGDLEGQTVVAGLGLTIILLGLAALAQAGRVNWATGLLVGLLWALITADVAAYGLGSPAAAAYFVPLALVSCSYGLGAAIGLTALSAGAVWLIAWATVSGRYQPYGPVELSHLTFNAPALTVLLLLVTVILGVWSASTGVAATDSAHLE